MNCLTHGIMRDAPKSVQPEPDIIFRQSARVGYDYCMDCVHLHTKKISMQSDQGVPEVI